MFDPTTASLITSAPKLDGLNLEDLPRRLTEAFTSIVTARIRLRGAATRDPAVEPLLRELRRLAATYEAYVALLQHRADRASSAFVSATAYQTYFAGAPNKVEGSNITAQYAAPEICSALLFLISNSKADAAEAAKRIRIPEEGSEIEQALVRALGDLCFGRPAAILSPTVPALSERSIEQRALDVVLRKLLAAVRGMAARLLRQSDPDGYVPVSQTIEEAKALCSLELHGILADDTVLSVIPGPLHIANLLLVLDRDLIDSATSRIPAPPGIEAKAWWSVIGRLAKRRPYLWPNHLKAIEEGYLITGTSAAVSFPTGAGKSTLSELKIAAALLNQKKVVFLAPTNALVEQTAKAFGKTFKTFEVMGDVADDNFELLILPELLVTTPERCLYLLSTQPNWFKDLGLLVFDECHLLHPRDTDLSRRSVDAMLAILNVVSAAPDADLLLLSAMMKNTQEIASWLKEMTGREALCLDLTWKPTRQARGCLVYSANRIAELKQQLRVARRDFPAHVSTPSSVKSALTAVPFALFGLLQTWSTHAMTDYSLLKLLDEAIELATGTNKRGWYLTPNANKVSASIAAAASASGTKTLVFVQTTVLCEGGVKNYAEVAGDRKIKLTEEELGLHSHASEEMGGPNHCYLEVKEGEHIGGAASHHSLLLPQERQLHEDMFRRTDGLDVLFATSTLAQGMNLPSDLVIIAGDSRFDSAANKMEQLQAHELLNAAGRAGRAGEAAQGAVMVVPSKVIEFDDKTSTINNYWMELQSVFGQSDQCLSIRDPLIDLLDNIHAGITKTGMEGYLVSRLVFSTVGDPIEVARSILGKSLAAFKAKQANDNDWVNSRIESALAARAERTTEVAPGWLERVSTTTAVAVTTLRELDELISTSSSTFTATRVMDSIFDWIQKSPFRLFEFVRPEAIESLFGQEYKKMTAEDKVSAALPVLRKCLAGWLAGKPLSAIERDAFGVTNVGKCKKARSFVIRTVPELAFLAGLPMQLHNSHLFDEPALAPKSTTIAYLRSCVREGCDSVDVLAVKREGGRKSRVAARWEYDELKSYIPRADDDDDLDSAKERIKTARINLAFDTD